MDVRLVLGLGFCTALACAQTTAAYELPGSLNLGATSFLDGAPPAGPGWYAVQYVQFYRNGRLKDDGGDDFRLPTPRGPEKAELDIVAGLTQLVYLSEQPLLWGGKWGVNLMLPYADLDLDPDDTPLSTNGGLGDLLLGPFLQWDPIMGPNGPRFVQRVELQLIFPTGSYDSGDALNAGSNYFSFNPYWSATAFLTPKWTASWRLHYLWNAKNEDPSVPYAFADDLQAGQAVHLNFSTAYEVLPKRLRLGVNGYYLQQITDSQLNGDDLDDSREKVLGIGPGLIYHFSQHDHLFFNAYRETAAENRSEGSRFNLRYVHHFH
jgi:hypothetical protein